MIEVYLWFNVIWLIRLCIGFAVLATLVRKFGKVWWLAPFKVIFYILDILMNWQISLLFWDKPGVWDETVSNRMIRYKSRLPNSLMNKFRIGFAKGLCWYLNIFDRNHCG